MERTVDELQPNNAPVTPELMAATQLTADDIAKIAKSSKLTHDQITQIANMAPLEKVKSAEIKAVDLMRAAQQNPSTLTAGQGWAQWGLESIKVLGQMRWLLTNPPPPTPTNVTTPPIMLDIPDSDAASASNTNEHAPVVTADPQLATTLADLNEQDLTIQAQRPAFIAPLNDPDPVIVSPPLAPTAVPADLFMEEEITLAEANETEAPHLEAEEELEERMRLEAEATAERERLDEIERVRLEAEATAERESRNRIEQARLEALAAAERQQTLLLQQQREREEAVRQQVEESRRQALLEAAERQRAIDAGIAAARAAGF